MKWRAPVALAASMAMGLAMAACAPSGFHCGASAACNGTSGEMCMPDGWCAKADSTCPGGMRYTMTAGAGLANQCASGDAGVAMDGVDGALDVTTETQMVDTGDHSVGITPGAAPPFRMPSTLAAPPVDCNSGGTFPVHVLVGVVTTPPTALGGCGVGSVSILCAPLTADQNPSDGALYQIHVGPHGAPIPVGTCADPSAANAQTVVCPDGQAVVDVISHRDALGVTTLALTCATPVVSNSTLGNGPARSPLASVCTSRMSMSSSDDACPMGLPTSLAPGTSPSEQACTPNEFGVQCTQFMLAN